MLLNKVGRADRFREAWAARGAQDAMRALLAAPDLPTEERTFVLTVLVGNELCLGSTGTSLDDLDAWSVEALALIPTPHVRVQRGGVLVALGCLEAAREELRPTLAFDLMAVDGLLAQAFLGQAEAALGAADAARDLFAAARAMPPAATGGDAGGSTGEKIGTHIVHMNWGSYSLPFQLPELLTSDRPVHWFDPPQSEGCHILMPVSPKRIFWATNTTDMALTIRTRPPADLLAFMNQHTVKRAVRYVYGQSDRHLAYVQEQMGVNPEVTIPDKLMRMQPRGARKRVIRASRTRRPNSRS